MRRIASSWRSAPVVGQLSDGVVAGIIARAREAAAAAFPPQSRSVPPRRSQARLPSFPPSHTTVYWQAAMHKGHLVGGIFGSNASAACRHAA